MAWVDWSGFGPLPSPPKDIMNWLAPNITNTNISPATITFSSSNPDAVASGSSTATVQWRIRSSSLGQPWTLQISADTSTLTSCGTVPASAVRATCNSVSITGNNPGTGACGGAVALSTAPQTIASGAQGSGAFNHNYTVIVSFTFTDQWIYKGAIAPTCSLGTTYTITATP
ncbi:MAG: hypothetical protein HYZ37_18760 [Candidatus Solibacter usitatus]|nr:hypothetical protein [Candidatus Solibacter usitatus]